MKNYIMRTYWDYKIVEEVLDLMEFELLCSKNDEGVLVLNIRDLQGANLGDIESERFADFDELMSRLDTYIDDYFLRGLEEEFTEIEDYNSLADLYNQLMQLPLERIQDNLWDINILGLFGGVYE